MKQLIILTFWSSLFSFFFLGCGIWMAVKDSGKRIEKTAEQRAKKEIHIIEDKINECLDSDSSGRVSGCVSD